MFFMMWKRAVLIVLTSFCVSTGGRYYITDIFLGDNRVISPKHFDYEKESVVKSDNGEESGGNFEGDMYISPELRSILEFSPRTGLLDQFRWPKDLKGRVIVPFTFRRRKEFPRDQKEFIRSALNKIEDVTCVKFVERKRAKDFVVIRRGAGCSSSVGRQGGPQWMTLQPSKCFRSKGIVIHEFLHALGFFHMQSAHDRDKYIRIMSKNIIPQNRHNFNKYTNRYISYYGTSYDYDSVMHYSSKAFSANGQDTIITRDPKYQTSIGKRLELSRGDIKRINNMYRCSN